MTNGWQNTALNDLGLDLFVFPSQWVNFPVDRILALPQIVIGKCAIGE